MGLPAVLRHTKTTLTTMQPSFVLDKNTDRNIMKAFIFAISVLFPRRTTSLDITRKFPGKSSHWQIQEAGDVLVRFGTSKIFDKPRFQWALRVMGLRWSKTWTVEHEEHTTFLMGFESSSQVRSLNAMIVRKAAVMRRKICILDRYPLHSCWGGVSRDNLQRDLQW